MRKRAVSEIPADECDRSLFMSIQSALPYEVLGTPCKYWTDNQGGILSFVPAFCVQDGSGVVYNDYD